VHGGLLTDVVQSQPLQPAFTADPNGNRTTSSAWPLTCPNLCTQPRRSAGRCALSGELDSLREVTLACAAVPPCRLMRG
jgi:hypothetical protein